MGGQAHAMDKNKNSIAMFFIAAHRPEWGSQDILEDCGSSDPDSNSGSGAPFLYGNAATASAWSNTGISLIFP